MAQFSQPGNNFTGLVENNLIIDPFKGTTEKELEWIGKESWEFKAEFTITKENFTKNILIYILKELILMQKFLLMEEKLAPHQMHFVYFFTYKDFY